MIECSTTGCRLISDRPAETGQSLRLSVFLPDVPWPLRVDQAVVRWVNGPEFGVEFVGIRSSGRERLRLVLMKLNDPVRMPS